MGCRKLNFSCNFNYIRNYRQVVYTGTPPPSEAMLGGPCRTMFRVFGAMVDVRSHAVLASVTVVAMGVAVEAALCSGCASAALSAGLSPASLMLLLSSRSWRVVGLCCRRFGLMRFRCFRVDYLSDRIVEVSRGARRC